MRTASNEVVARTTADQDGVFQIGPLESGSYTVVAWAGGFRAKRLANIVVRDGQITDVGHVQLDFAGCDAPGVICDTVVSDSVATAVPNRVLSYGHITLKLGCGVGLQHSTVYCPNADGALSNRALDAQLTRDADGVYLDGANGATFSAPDNPAPGCGNADGKLSRVRLDGLGPGDDICVYMSHGHYSHLFLTSEAERNSGSVSLWQTTSRR